jgi:3-dehydroquinate synthase class II
VGADKAGLEQRLTVLDARIARIEQDIEENGRALASPEAARVASQQEADRTPAANIGDHATPILIVFTIFVLMPLAVSIARLLWKRSSLPPRAAVPSETAQRLERMEQAMDAIAIEVERVSEGQRFVTRILTEGRSEAVLGAAEPEMQPVRAASEGLSTAR